jgi:hypothetical protein
MNVNVFLWQAGTAEGVTDSPGKARRHAARWMRRQETDTARVEPAHFVSGIETLDAGYLPSSAPHWTGRRHPSGRVTWRLRAPSLERPAP